MKTCPNCGNQIEDNAAFCNNCGVSVAVNTQSEVTDSNSNSAQSAAGQSAAGMQQGMQPNFQQAPYQQPYTYADPKDHTREYDVHDISDNKMFGVAAYLFGIIGIILAALINTPYTRFHAKNSLRLSIAAILLLIPCVIPVLGWIVSGVCEIILGIIRIIAIVWAFQGKAKDAPIVGDIGFLK